MTVDQTETWDAAVANFAAVVAGIDDWSVPSPCPGWDIADLVSHTIDLEAMLAADPRPEHSLDWATLPHIDSDFGRMTEIGVDYRRGRSRDKLLTELDDVHARAHARVESLGPDASIPWLRGDTPIAQLLGMRTFDIWMHEQDAREAVNMGGNLDGPGAANALRYLSAGLPKVWAKGVGAPPGAVLQVTITEPGITGEFWVLVNEDGKASLVDQQPADVHVTMPWLTFVMLAGGRSTRVDHAGGVVVVGDPELGASLLTKLAITP